MSSPKPSSGKQVCLVTTAQVSYNPRLVKEADALAQAGYQVRVVAVSQNAEKDQLDRALTARRPWRLEVVKAHRRGPGRARWLLAVLRQQICLRASRFVAAAGLQGRAYSRFGPELARLAAHQRADLYIGHTLPALPAVVWAARRHGARLGFDAEDFQSGIRALHASPTHEDRLSEAIEAEYLPQCDHLTSASPGVSQALAELCGGRVPVPVLNVFSLADRPSRRPQRPAGGPLRLYWFSHVVGTDRGLEDAVLALRQLPAGSAELHLRGQCDSGARAYVAGLVAKAGVHTGAVIVHDPAPSDQMVALCGGFDVGLALEVPYSRNRIICMNDLCTNKVFTYLMGGLALAASAMNEGSAVYEGAGFSYRTGDAAALAAGLRRWMEHPTELQAAKDRAWELAGTRYNWEAEQHKLLAAVECVLAGGSSSGLGRA